MCIDHLECSKAILRTDLCVILLYLNPVQYRKAVCRILNYEIFLVSVLFNLLSILHLQFLHLFMLFFSTCIQVQSTKFK